MKMDIHEMSYLTGTGDLLKWTNVTEALKDGCLHPSGAGGHDGMNLE